MNHWTRLRNGVSTAWRKRREKRKNERKTFARGGTLEIRQRILNFLLIGPVRETAADETEN